MHDRDLEELSEIFRIHSENDKREFESARDRDMQISTALTTLNSEIKELRTTLKPISDAYNGFIFSKSFVTGAASFVLALGAIGGAIIALIRFAK